MMSDIEQRQRLLQDMTDNVQGNSTIEEELTICARCRNAILSRKFLKSLLLGQLVSLLICGTAVTTGLLQEQGVNVPTAQSFANYVLLCLVFAVMLTCRRTGRSFVEILKTWWWKYLLIALVDVEANYLVVKAYGYTTITSVQLLDCFSILSVMVLSYFFLQARYRVLHVIGAATCLLGMGGLVLTDVLVGRNQNKASNAVLGDIFVIAGATLYGVSNVCQEYIVHAYDKVEFLGMVGLFGSFINGIQFVLLERQELAQIDLSYKVVLPLVGFVLCQFLLYAAMSVIIKLTSATIVNLSILSADFYTLLFGLFLFGYKFHVLYFVSFCVIVLGLFLYLALSPAQTNTSERTREIKQLSLDTETTLHVSGRVNDIEIQK